jgi:hypothetical protein
VIDNPYQPPGVASEDSPPSDLIQQLEVRTMEWFLRANDGVVFMMVVLAIAMALLAVSGYFTYDGASDFPLFMVCPIVGFLAAALAWFQWRYHIAAITISGMVSLAMTLMIIGLMFAVAMRSVGVPARSSTWSAIVWENAALFIGLAFVFAWIYSVALPMRVAVQAWTWHRQGIDLSRLREEIRRRG